MLCLLIALLHRSLYVRPGWETVSGMACLCGLREFFCVDRFLRPLRCVPQCFVWIARHVPTAAASCCGGGAWQRACDAGRFGLYSAWTAVCLRGFSRWHLPTFSLYRYDHVSSVERKVQA